MYAGSLQRLGCASLQIAGMLAGAACLGLTTVDSLHKAVLGGAVCVG